MPTQTPSLPGGICLPEELNERVQGLAAARRSSANALVVQAVTAFVEREEKREDIRRECIAASEHYRQTGMHVAHAEVKEWLAKLRQGKKAEPPECHM